MEKRKVNLANVRIYYLLHASLCAGQIFLADKFEILGN